jgi:hypothetical protein
MLLGIGSSTLGERRLARLDDPDQARERVKVTWVTPLGEVVASIA